MGNALLATLDEVMENNFVHRLSKELEQQAGTLPGLQDPMALRRLAGNPAQECIAAHAARLASEVGAANVMQQAIHCAVDELADRSFRHTESYVAQHSPRDLPELMQRMRSCRRRVDLGALVEARAAGKAARPMPRPRLDIDAPLPLGPRGGVYG